MTPVERALADLLESLDALIVELTERVKPTPPPRRRGRPPKATVVTLPPKRRRGRPPGSRNRPKPVEAVAREPVPVGGVPLPEHLRPGARIRPYAAWPEWATEHLMTCRKVGCRTCGRIALTEPPASLDLDQLARARGAA